MIKEYLEYTDETEYDGYLAAEGYPKRGIYQGKTAPEDKQQTERPHPFEVATDGKVYVRGQQGQVKGKGRIIPEAAVRAKGLFKEAKAVKKAKGVLPK